MIVDAVIDKVYPWIKVMYQPRETVLHAKHEVDLKDDDWPIMQTWFGKTGNIL